MNALTSKLALAAALTAGVSLVGCTTAPYNNGGNYNRGYQSQQSGYGNGYGNQSGRCQACGVVQDVQQVYTGGSSGNGGTLGAIIGAVAGGVLGNTVGKGDGRKAATVVGAVAGGVVGNQIGKRNDSGGDAAWRIVVRLDNGQYATVTQREDPGLRNGDYVEVRGDHVYAR
ncbi:MAG TPA: glycine zipper 2TM domain-containing protein [Rhodanobacter sp.]|jgi:outer membrane lipoprotein SlyB|nr:glycine zipper 2TM domain-containing protein [Rhodanobacter sp.]